MARLARKHELQPSLGTSGWLPKSQRFALSEEISVRSASVQAKSLFFDCGFGKNAAEISVCSTELTTIRNIIAAQRRACREAPENRRGSGRRPGGGLQAALSSQPLQLFARR